MIKGVIENLIVAVSRYGVNVNWCDSEIIDTLVSLGVTEQDFKDCGYWSFVKEYFENN